MLERKDVRLKLDHDIHAAAKAIAESDGLEIAEWIESIVSSVIVKRVHQSTLIVDALAASGSLGPIRDKAGKR